MLNTYVGFTLIDITDSGDNNPKGYSHPYKQSQNLNSLTQTLAMRTQLLDVQVKVLPKQDLSDYDFGDAYSGTHTVWEVRFSSDIEAWKLYKDEFYYALHDVNNVPVATRLNETIESDDNAMICYGNTKNMYFAKTYVTSDG
jgi:hypothetical protein